VPAGGQTEESLMAMMLGRSIDAAFPAKRLAPADARTVLSVRDLVAPGVNGVSFDLREGEILGLAGLVGAGRTEVARAIYRANRVHSGSVSILTETGGSGESRVTGTPRSAMRAGVAMIPESRKEQGLLLGRPVKENVSLSTLAQISVASMVQPGADWGSRRRRCPAGTSRSSSSPARCCATPRC
jgi:rhamnose transport system ATP-binding protein